SRIDREHGLCAVRIGGVERETGDAGGLCQVVGGRYDRRRKLRQVGASREGRGAVTDPVERRYLVCVRDKVLDIDEVEEVVRRIELHLRNEVLVRIWIGVESRQRRPCAGDRFGNIAFQDLL